MVYKFFDKRTSGKGIKNENISNKKSTKQLCKPIIRTFHKRKEHSSFIDKIWGADLAEMQLTSKFNKGFRILLFVIDIYSKYPWVISLKNKESIAIINAFRKNLNESNRKSNKIWVDKGSEFYNSSMKSWLEKNNIEMYLAHNEEKSVIARRFIRTLKNELYKYMTSVSKIFILINYMI